MLLTIAIAMMGWIITLIFQMNTRISKLEQRLKDDEHFLKEKNKKNEGL